MNWSAISGIILILSYGIGIAVYAENEYSKKSELTNQFRSFQVEQYQIKIDVLNNVKAHGKLSPAQTWELQYFTDKKNNLLKDPSSGR